MTHLSKAAWSLWGKKGKNDNTDWLPLPRHMEDTAGIASLLWREWLSEGVRHRIAAGLSKPGDAEKLVRFLGAAHDLGKATPLFQAKQRSFPADDLDQRLMVGLLTAGLKCRPADTFLGKKAANHTLATETLLRAMGCPADIAAVLGAHHGRPASSDDLLDGQNPRNAINLHLGLEGKAGWQAVQQELLSFCLRLAAYDSLEELPRLDFHVQILLIGLVIMSDWIASNESLFPYIDINQAAAATPLDDRVGTAWTSLRLPKAWMRDPFKPVSDYYLERFQIALPFAAQDACLAVAQAIVTPGILVLEAPMGSGKTEAALVAAEIFAEKAMLDGVFFALPTQATSNAMFSRLRSWTKALSMDSYAIRLAHGKAQFNTEYAALMEGSRHIGEESGDAVVHQWFEGNKKSLLADFVVGTIDQFLMASLRQKHVMLRHLGLAGKVVILDECHAYDAYMNRYLDRTLHWMGAYGVPVIVLSATLPAKRRTELISAYLGKPSPLQTRKSLPGKSVPAPEPPHWTQSEGYPLITWTDAQQVHQQEVADNSPPRAVCVQSLRDEQLIPLLQRLLARGGVAGVIVNTVRRAQYLAEQLAGVFGAERVTLTHAGFIIPDRVSKEEEILRLAGKSAVRDPSGAPHIVVGTQVIEQSLDLDFDVLVSDLCPMDLLLQRIGRLHRHQRFRPAGLEDAACYVLGTGEEGFEPGSVAVYHAYALMRSKALLPRGLIHLPADIPSLVHRAYDESWDPDPLPPGYQQAKADWDNLVNRMRERAGTYRLVAPLRGGELTGMLEHDIQSKGYSEAEGEAAVRDAADSVEVLVVCAQDGDMYSPLPWQAEGQMIPGKTMPRPEAARLLARQGLRLPHALCHNGIIQQTIKDLEASNQPLAAWQLSPWLKGQLFLILDQKLQSHLGGYTLTYSRAAGLTLAKEGSVHEGEGI